MKTLLSLLVIASVSLASCDKAHDLTSAEQITAETGARRTLSVFQSCSGRDSDGDGYVTCEGRERPDTPVVSLLCAYKNNSVGCKRK